MPPVKVTAEVKGVVGEVKVKSGDNVKEGDIIAILVVTKVRYEAIDYVSFI